MPRLSSDELRRLTAAIFRAAGASEEDAELVGDSLVESEMAGHESHGLTRVKEYLKHIGTGAIDPGAVPEVVRDGGTTLVVDGHWGFGQVVATHATRLLIERVAEHGTAAVAIRNCAHVGRAGVYPAQAAQHGFAGFAYVNGGGSEARVAPHGGGKPLFGTNPLAAAIPMPGGSPMVLDFSTAIVASGKIRVLRDRGEPLPEGWILDPEGRPSTDPADYYAGGMLLPAAAHKGYALSLIVELLAGALTGAGSLAIPGSDYRVGNGMFMQAFDVSAFIDADRFAALAGALAENVRGCPPADGFDAVLLPGDPERLAAQHADAAGVDVAESTWKAMAAAAADLGVPV